MEATLIPSSRGVRFALEVGHTVALTGLHVVDSTISALMDRAFDTDATWTEVQPASSLNLP